MTELIEVQENTDAGHDITLAEALTWLRQNYGTDVDEDALTTSLIKSAVHLTERYTGLSFSAKTLTAYFECWDTTIELPYGPINTVTEVRQKVDGVTEILDASTYSVNGGQFKKVSFGYVYSTSAYVANFLEVDYSTIAPTGNVYETFKNGVFNYLTNMYSHRGEISSGNLDNETKKILFPISRNI